MEKPLEARPPTLQDLLKLCENLNRKGVKYMVIGGMAIAQHGFTRATEDIDLLVDTSIENERRLKEALLYLPDKAAEDLEAGDIESYMTVRVADEIVIDLMKSACNVDYERAAKSIVTVELEGISIPFASVDMLWEMKQTVREKDLVDRIFLAEKLKI
uniref:Nucleotidyl transferase AbiEii toxin, Type IV TA system n=1 Tax=Candidatus Kentrum sp. DK TaxID=2126562 RepID=A0A450S5B0_9GAMM|nr:MAG: hypothetical protein BECKDK2373B_GA0170837_101535 [Candidatus Kentron sp. DK]